MCVRLNIPILILSTTVILVACSKSEPEIKNGVEPILEAAQPIYDTSKTTFSCPYSEQREIFFTSSRKKDTLNIQIVGDDCDAAQILLSIVKQDGGSVHNTEARALSYTYEDEGAAGVERMLETLVTSEYYLESLADIDALTEDNGYYEVDKASAIEARNNNAPLFCHKAGKSYSNCFAFIDQKSVLIFSSGS